MLLDIFVGLGALALAGPGFLAALEYRRINALRCLDKLQELKRRLRDHRAHADVMQMVERNTPSLAAYDARAKRELLAVYEEAAVMCAARLVGRPLAYHLFGPQLIRLAASETFWANLDRSSRAHALVLEFAREMQEHERAYRFDWRHLRL